MHHEHVTVRGTVLAVVRPAHSRQAQTQTRTYCLGGEGGGIRPRARRADDDRLNAVQ